MDADGLDQLVARYSHLTIMAGAGMAGAGES